MMKISDETIEKANNTNLFDYVMSQGYEGKVKGKKFYFKEHDSLNVDIEKNYFYWNSRNIKGYPIQFLQYVEGYEWKDAVLRLSGEDIKISNEYSNEYNKKNNNEDEKKLLMPNFDNNTKSAYAYLCGKRRIDKEIINFYIKNGFIKQETNVIKDKKNMNVSNILFIGRNEENEISYISKRGIKEGHKFRGEQKGSKKEYGFKYIGTNNVLNVFEAPIDLLSKQSLDNMQGLNWKEDSCLSLGGVDEKALMKLLELNVERYSIINLCLDNDEAGKNAIKNIKNILEKTYPNKFIINEKLPRNGKDYNENLIISKSVNYVDEFQEKGIDPNIIYYYFDKAGDNNNDKFSDNNLSNIGNNNKLLVFENEEDLLSLFSIAQIKGDKSWLKQSYIIMRGDNTWQLNKVLKENKNINNLTFCFSKNSTNKNKVEKIKDIYPNKEINIHISKTETYLEGIKTINNIKKVNIETNELVM